MKRILLTLVLLPIAASIAFGDNPQKVMARYVPQRYDDFVFENNLVAGRIYGEALESCGKGQVTTPGIDVWVKTPGALVCEQRYIDDLQNHRTYHRNWGNGKDCYKVGRSLGAGASVPIIGGKPAYPATNYRSWEIVEYRNDKVVFILTYPEWECEGVKLSLSKKFTIVPDSYFIKVEDSYTFSGGTLDIAAGVFRHPGQQILESEKLSRDRYAIWEGASDQSIEKDPESRLGVAVVVPGATSSVISEDGGHAFIGKTIRPGETFVYYFGSCWNGGDIKEAEAWFKMVKRFKNLPE